MLKIGCHLSSSKGFEHMGREALKINANTFQFFTRNPRGGSAKSIDPDDAARLMELTRQHGFGPLVAHAPYTLNPCSKDQKTRDFAYMAMADDLARMEYIPGNYYNFHPGSHVGQGVETAVELIGACLDQAMWEGQAAVVLLETMAGKGSEVGSRFEELRAIIDRAKYPHRIGVCLDTCHVFDAGYDIVEQLDEVLEEFDRIVGLDRLKAIHINDSKNPFASHKDRHEKLGQGFMGWKTFEMIVNHPKLKDLPFFLETPNELDGYAQEIRSLRACRED
jgi:deoxyribonuclease-4